MNPGDDGIINFRVRSNGREWEVNNIIIERKGFSGYVAYIYDKEEVKEERKEEEGRPVGRGRNGPPSNLLYRKSYNCFIKSLTFFDNLCYH